MMPEPQVIREALEVGLEVLLIIAAKVSLPTIAIAGRYPLPFSWRQPYRIA